MATSNSYNYTVDRDTLIRMAFEDIGMAVEGEDLDADLISVAARALNVLIKAWTAHGLQVWKRKTYTIDPLVANKKYYDLGTAESNAISLTGTGTTATATLAYHGYNTGDSVVITGASDSNYNGTYTITVTSPSAFTYSSTGSGADSGTCTPSVTADVPRPERLLSVDRADSSGNGVDLVILTREEFDSLPNKTTSGTPVHCHYERRLGAGRLHIWPVADSVAVSNYTLEITYQAPIEDVDSSTDNLDFPPEWIDALHLNLAVRLAPKYGYPLMNRYLLRKEAEEALMLAKDHDNEDGSILLQVERE